MYRALAFNLRKLGLKTLVILILSILLGFLDAVGIISLIPLFKSLSIDELPENDKFYQIFNIVGLTFNLSNLFFLVSLLFILKATIRFFSSLYQIKIIHSFSKNLRIELINKYNFLDVNFLSKVETGEIQYNFSSEIPVYVSGIRQTIVVLRDISMILLYVIFAFLSNKIFTFLIFVFTICALGWFYLLNLKVKNISRNLVNINHKFSSKILEHITYIKYLKMSGVIKKTTKQIHDLIASKEFFEKKSSSIQSFIISIKEPILIFVLLSSVYVHINIFNGDFESIVITLILFIRTLQKSVGIQDKILKLNTIVGSIENIYNFQNFLDKKKQINNNRKLVEYNSLKSEIIVKNLSLHLGEKRILSNINLNIKRNEKVAFVGESGGGKSSLINSIAGFYKIESGNIHFDNISLNQINLNSFHKNIGYVSQNPVIFHASVFDNITLWDEKNEINQKRFLNVIKQVMIDETIFNLPLKEDTLIEKNGENFSQGQNQRICIARELYKKPSLLFLDEATSSLDSEMKDYIIKTIVKTYTNMTLISISHDISNLNYFDKIYQVHKGEIIYGGNFNQLLKKSKSFKNMVEIQKING